MTRVEHLMGTVFTVTILDAAPCPDVMDVVFGWLRAVEARFSTFVPDSEISLIGRGLLDIDEASSDVRHVLARGEELEAATGHRFSMRPGRPGGPGIDPAGFVKGWAVDEAALRLQVDGVERFSIDAGGDLLCVGQSNECDGWRIGIRHPDAPETMGAVLCIAGGAVATSGRYFRGDHIWGRSDHDRPVTSVTVVGPSLGVADALATAIYADQAASLAWMQRFPEYGVVLMTADQRIRWTADLDDLIDVT